MLKLLARIALLLALPLAAFAAEYRLGAGDVVRITVYNNPDLATEAQLTQAGRITFPLIGEVAIGGLDKAAAESLIADRLTKGGFVKNPQVNVLVATYRSQQVSVLGQVNKPGRYSIDGAMTLTEVLALAGGVSPAGADAITLIRTDAGGKPVRREVDLNRMMTGGDLGANVDVAHGDILYVPRAPLFYIYGEVQRPGAFRLEPGMTVMQALSVGGGLTQRGTDKGLKLNRRNGDGKVSTIEPSLTDAVRENDVVYVKESLF